ncbi:MAG: MFS transporter [Acidiferrobacter sp.]
MAERDYLGKKSRRNRWLTRNVAAIALLSLFSDMGHEMVTSVMPFFIATLGGSAAAVGLVEGVSDLFASLAKIWLPHYSERIGQRRRFLLIGYVLTALKGVMAAATSWFAVLAIRVVAWIGRGMRGPVRDAMLADSVPAAYFGRAFGLHRAADTVGAIAGPTIALGLLMVGWNYREIFLMSLLPGGITILIVIFMIREVSPRPGHGRGFRESLRGLPREFLSFTVASGVFGLGNFGPMLLILYAQQQLAPAMGTTRADTWAIGLYMLFNLTYALGAYPAGLLSEHMGKWMLLVQGYLLFTLMCVGFLVFDGSVVALPPLFALGGLYIAIVDTMEGALAAELLPEQLRTTGYGVLGTVNGVGDLVSSLVVGLLWARVSVASGLIYAAALTGVGAGLLFAWTPARR